MITCPLADFSRYEKAVPHFRRAFDFLQQFRTDTKVGRYELDGDRIFALVQHYETAPAETKKFEAHRTYLDVQYVASGNECLLYAPLGRLRSLAPYSPEKDVELFTEDPAAVIALNLAPGQLTVFFPEDGHKPGCLFGPSQPVVKVVLKIKVAG